jgi:hypothetical protein
LYRRWRLGLLEPWTCGLRIRIAFTALNAPKDKNGASSAWAVDTTYFLWTQYKKAHKRRETLQSCEDYRHTRFYTIYHAIRNVDISLSGNCEYPIVMIDIGGPERKIGSLIGSKAPIVTLPNALVISTARSS